MTKVKEEVVEGFQLSPQQKHLYTSSQVEGRTPYRTLCAVLIEGELEPGRLEAAVEEVVARHEILRTTFRRLPGLSLPVQVIDGEGGSPRLGRHDLRGADEAEQSALLEEHFRGAKRLVFEFENGPLLQLSLFRLADDRSVLMLCIPAASADAAGMKNIVREIGARCGAGPSADLADGEPVQYADVSSYLTELLESEETEAGRRFWRDLRIAGYPEPRLPFEGWPEEEEAAEFAPEHVSRSVAPERVRRIEEAARRCGTTPAVFLLGCWNVLLWRLTGQSKPVVGAAFSGRRVEGLEELPGLFERYLPVACELEGRLRFSDLLGQLDAAASAVAEWQDYFNWEYPATGGGARLLPFCFEYDEGPDRFDAGGLRLKLVKLYSCVERFKVRLSARLYAEAPALEFHFDPRLYDARAVSSLAEQFDALLSSACDDVESPVGRLNMLSADVRRRLLTEFNATKTTHTDEPVHRLFDNQAALTPKRTAVVCARGRLSYEELGARADRLASRLRALGVGPDVPVAVCLERSTELLVAILGVLKAGGAYVPLEPTNPAARLAFIMDDTRAPVLLTQERLRASLPESGARVICVDAAGDDHAEARGERDEVNVTGDNLAYVIYTSGSTGQPKGVMVTHRGLTNYLAWAGRAYDVGGGGGAPVHSSVGFDLTVTSLFTPLLAGEKVLMVGSEAGPEALADALRGGGGFSLVKITPPHLYVLGQLMSGAEAEGAAGAFVIGGEALFAESLDFWRTHAPRTRLINEYGPTETVVGCCVYEVGGDERLRGAVPIGRPIANTRLFVLDEELNPTPLNVPGEIYIGGCGLARGYLNRPELTAERFVPDPFSGEPGARLYRTGDLGRHRADGNLEYLGRSDSQVKVRGYRVELGEVEAVLSQHPEVSEAAVVLREEESGEKRLVGYVVSNGSAEFSASRVREHMKERLPEYMIPSAFVALERMPLTSNGKVDRRSLPAPDSAARGNEGAYAPPRTQIEELLAGLWAKALGLERVGVEDDFFELGGDSILSIQLANRAGAHGVRFAPRQVFQHRTIRALASTLSPAAAGRAADEGVVTGEAPLTPVQRWFFEHDFEDMHHWNQALMLEAREPLDAERLERALRELVLHHDALRMRFVRDETGWRQFGAQPAADAVLTESDLSGLGDGERESALRGVASDLQSGLNLSGGRLMRAALVRQGSGRPDLLLIVVHHLAVDIVSWAVLLENLHDAYRQLCRGESVKLPAKTTTYREWAGRLAEYAESPKLRRELAFWLGDAARAQEALVPLDFPGGGNTEASARKVKMSLSREETKALSQEATKAARAMVNDLLLAALARAFARWAHATTLLVDLENHGREEIFDDVELSRTVGWFTCIFPARLDVGRSRGPGEALKAVEAQVRRAPNGGIGYGLLRYVSRDPEASARLGALPRAEVSFNYVGRAAQGVAESGLFSAAREMPAPSHAPRGRRPYVFEINGGIDTDGRLQMTFTYSENLHRRSSVERLGEEFMRAALDIVEHCIRKGARPDFPSGGAGAPSLEDLIAELDEDEE